VQQPNVLIQHDAQSRYHNDEQAAGNEPRMLHANVDEDVQYERDEE
jgi:hypothetical protein